MTVSEIMNEMIKYPGNTLHDIAHLMKVYAFAKTIGELEQLDEETQTTLEIAAVIHDIACPLCREKYGSTDGRYQEAEGMRLADEFLSGKGLPDDMKARVVYLVGHHHTYTDVEGLDYQILLEADFLVNADESGCSESEIRSFTDRVFKTETGIEMMRSVYKCI